MARRKMRVALHHAQGLPASKLLNSSQIYTVHHKPAGERVTIAVPSVAVEMGGILPRDSERRLSPTHGLRERPGDVPVRPGEDELVGIVGTRPLRTNVEQHGAHHAVHRHLPGST